MEMIPILSDLTNEQFESLLSICTKLELKSYKALFKEGEVSSELYILTDGVLKVTLRGSEIARINPISTVGEMGVFTDKPRSASIVTMSKCTILKIVKDDLFTLFEKDKDFHIKFQKGMLLDMAQKLHESNELIVKLRSKII